MLFERDGKDLEAVRGPFAPSVPAISRSHPGSPKNCRNVAHRTDCNLSIQLDTCTET